MNTKRTIRCVVMLALLSLAVIGSACNPYVVILGICAHEHYTEDHEHEDAVTEEEAEPCFWWLVALPFIFFSLWMVSGFLGLHGNQGSSTRKKETK